MKYINKYISTLKGESFKIDERIEYMDIINIIMFRVLGLIRGNFRTIGVKKKGKCFVGKNVKITCKRKVFLDGGNTIGNNVEIDALSQEGVMIGKNSKIGDYSMIKCTGTIRNLGKGIVLGKNFGCGEFCFFGAAGGISIGDDVIMGQSVKFHSENHNFDKIDIPIRHQGVVNKGIKVGNDCWIGSGVTFLDGITVGNGCVIGANTLVNRDIPNYSIAVGNPVKIIGSRLEEY